MVHVPTDVNRAPSVPNHLKITCSDVNDDDTPFHPRFVDPATKSLRETHTANATPGSRSDISWPGRAKATVPGHRGHHQEVDDADPEPAAGAQSVGDPL